MGAIVIWRSIRSSVVGSARHNAALPCQDFCYANVITAGDGQEYLMCLVADGAGSAREGGMGAEIVCSTVRTGIENALDRHEPGLNQAAVTDWITDARQAIAAVAIENNLEPRDYACTLIGAVVNPGRSLFFQIGDGAIVISSGITLGVVFWPQEGPYANMTHFITDDDALFNLQVTAIGVGIDELALFSDGLQRLVLNFSQQTPHAPFFEPMLHLLRATAPEGCINLNDQLTLFLDSPPINARTNDDKTLILATRRPP